MNFGERLRKIRESRNLTQKELANKLGNDVAHNTISNWEKMITSPNVDMVYKLCEVLNIEPNYLFGYDIITPIYDKIVEENIKKGGIDALSEEQWEEVLNYTGYVKYKEEKKNKDK